MFQGALTLDWTASVLKVVSNYLLNAVSPSLRPSVTLVVRSLLEADWCDPDWPGRAWTHLLDNFNTASLSTPAAPTSYKLAALTLLVSKLRASFGNGWEPGARWPKRPPPSHKHRLLQQASTYGVCLEAYNYSLHVFSHPKYCLNSWISP